MRHYQWYPSLSQATLHPKRANACIYLRGDTPWTPRGLIADTAPPQPRFAEPGTAFDSVMHRFYSAICAGRVTFPPGAAFAASLGMDLDEARARLLFDTLLVEKVIDVDEAGCVFAHEQEVARWRVLSQRAAVAARGRLSPAASASRQRDAKRAWWAAHGKKKRAENRATSVEPEQRDDPPAR